jgi:nicotinamidase-related amidase
VSTKPWDALLTEQDRTVYASGAFFGPTGFGSRPALVIVDVLNKSIGDEPLPILEAMERFGKSCCGEYGWAAIPHIQSLIAAARHAHLPIIYTIPQAPAERDAETLSRFEEKMPNWMDYRGGRDGYAFADEIAPAAGDVIIEKPTASSFYGTELDEWLRREGVDCLIVTGGATSGCVRATIVDAHARGLKVNVPEDAVFDRGQVTHAMNLFDIEAKYADVLSTVEVVDRINGLSASLAGVSTSDAE